MFKKIVVVGMGYVGIPVAVEFANAGFDVVGVEILKWKVDWIDEGKCPIQGNEPMLAELLEKVVKNNKLRATQDFSVCREADAILICTETPFDLKRKEPNYSALKSAVSSVAENIRKKSLIVVESTIAPKTMEKVVKPILEKTFSKKSKKSFGVDATEFQQEFLAFSEKPKAFPENGKPYFPYNEKNGKKAGKDFYLANCPERVMPGKLLHNIENLDRVVGGIDQKSQELAVELYSHIVKGKLYPADCLTAEVVKTVENAYRDVQIGFANEIALICEKLGIDVFEVRELVNKCPYRNMHLPGAGVGGHCLPKDSWLLAYSVKDKIDPRMLMTAREINENMPLHMIELIEECFKEIKKDLKKSKISIFGLAYLQNSDDTRNTPSLPIIEKLKENGADVIVHDPYVKEYEGTHITDDIDKSLKGSDCLVLVTAHDEYKKLNLKKIKELMGTPLIVDGRNLFSKKECEKEGFVYKGVGK